jgi:hypothetical protein
MLSFCDWRRTQLIFLITSQAILAELTHVMRDYFGYSDGEAYILNMERGCHEETTQAA